MNHCVVCSKTGKDIAKGHLEPQIEPKLIQHMIIWPDLAPAP